MSTQSVRGRQPAESKGSWFLGFFSEISAQNNPPTQIQFSSLRHCSHIQHECRDTLAKGAQVWERLIGKETYCNCFLGTGQHTLAIETRFLVLTFEVFIQHHSFVHFPFWCLEFSSAGDRDNLKSNAGLAGGTIIWWRDITLDNMIFLQECISFNIWDYKIKLTNK